MSFARKLPDRPRREREPGEFANHTPRSRQAARCSAELMTALEGIAALPASSVAAVLPKVQAGVNHAIRESARGEECQVRIVGVCRGGTEHTIWSHAPLGAAGKGRGIKSLDVAGAYCCTACDAALDQAQRPAGMTREQVLLDWFHGHMRSLVMLARKGLL